MVRCLALTAAEVSKPQCGLPLAAAANGVWAYCLQRLHVVLAPYCCGSGRSERVPCIGAADIKGGGQSVAPHSGHSP
eukprot:CAMPEP_0206305130 /NCGR_PEP_ID=MMETSP0106_2-20121207/10103_1 /ASSEMBLY_ACC=CAM_ASM_000206 /TAXON_ID=81532 /ORGANISM="Acanthoeca-like sp., Strain 10tr" /LENGTH=76 /DNA_ID=CAMNT_0053735965 /DNA_START=941 /DNA_END=1171 /DNA_ORIENTATION=-